MASKSWLRYGVSVILIAGSTLGLINTYGDNSEVLALARVAACGREDCTYSLLRQSRSAISHEYTLQVALVQKGKSGVGATAEVECRRELLLLGDWHCQTRAPSAPAP